MSSMRKCMYQLVLDRHVNHVVEYGRAPYEELQQFKVSSIRNFVVFLVGCHILASDSLGAELKV